VLPLLSPASLPVALSRRQYRIPAGSEMLFDAG
jgi:hypothetical protein